MRQNVIQSSFLSGVLSPEAAARVDTEAYNQGLLTGINIVPRPLGGVRRRPGLRFVDTLPNILLRVTSNVTATAPNGGTAANANDGSTSTLLTTTTDVSTLNPFVAVHYDLGAAKAIQFADVLAFKSTGGSSTEFRIQYSANNSTWTDFGDTLELVDTTSRSYRRGSITAVSARYWRVAKVGGTNMGAVDTSLQEFNLWQGTGAVSEVRLFQFEVSTETRYLVALTDRSATVYLNDALFVSLPSPYTSADLAEVDGAQNQDSLVLVHEDYAPRFLYPELGTMYSEPIVFNSLPQYDFDDTSSPTPTSCVQTITFASGWIQGETFQVELEGARTGTITFAGDASADAQSATAANIAREIQKLYTVQAFTGVSCARTGALTYTVTFAEGSAKDYELMSLTPLSVAAARVVTAALTTPGVARTEDVWSATRGWPRTVTFFEGRMYFGGTRSLSQSVFGSRVNQILEYEITEAEDDDGVFTTLAGQQLNAIQGLYSGRSLQLFTSGGEYRYAKQPGAPITPGDAPANQTQYGAAKIRPVAIDGATIYVQRTKKAIRDFRYNYEEDAFNSLGISSLAPHLINDVVDLTAWNGSSTDEICLVFVVNGDGTVAVYNSRREANVSAWCQWTTEGVFKAASALLEEVYFAVQRVIDGTDTLFLEVADDDHYTDCSVGGPTVATASVIDIGDWYLSGGQYMRLVETAAAHNISAGDVATITGIVTSTGTINVAWVVASVPSTTTFVVQGKASSMTGWTYVSGGSVTSGTSNTLSGLGHLDGETLRVRADGFVLADSAPTSGSITLGRVSSYAEAGLNFDPTVTPMPLNMMTDSGANFMRKRRVVKVRARVYNTLGLLVNGRPLPDHQFDVANFDAPSEPYSGVKAIEESTDWDEDVDKTVTFTQVDPMPMTLLGIDVTMEGNS